MKKTNSFNDITPQNGSVETSRNDFLSQKYVGTNKINLSDVDKIDNTISARKRENVKKKTENIAGLVKKVALIVSATSIGVVSGIVEIPSITTSIVAEIQEAEGFGEYVFYSVSLSEFEEGCKVVLYNDFTNREENIEEPSASGVFEGVKENMYYTLAVKKGSKVLAKTQVYTRMEKESYEDEPEDPTTSDDPVTEDPTQGPNSDDPTTGGQ